MRVNGWLFPLGLVLSVLVLCIVLVYSTGVFNGDVEYRGVIDSVYVRVKRRMYNEYIIEERTPCVDISVGDRLSIRGIVHDGCVGDSVFVVRSSLTGRWRIK
jgi:hypothetical protein